MVQLHCFRNASDIPEGDFEAAKREVERLRLLISRVSVTVFLFMCMYVYVCVLYILLHINNSVTLCHYLTCTSLTTYLGFKSTSLTLYLFFTVFLFYSLPTLTNFAHFTFYSSPHGRWIATCWKSTKTNHP